MVPGHDSHTYISIKEGAWATKWQRVGSKGSKGNDGRRRGPGGGEGGVGRGVRQEIKIVSTHQHTSIGQRGSCNHKAGKKWLVKHGLRNRGAQ